MYHDAVIDCKVFLRFLCAVISCIFLSRTSLNPSFTSALMDVVPPSNSFTLRQSIHKVVAQFLRRNRVSLKLAQGQIHPWMMGGEYLPDLKMSQVEICRIVSKSTTMDVFSIRARKIDQKLHYSVADEYGDNEYRLPQVSSLEPLTMGALIENLDSCIEVSTPHW